MTCKPQPLQDCEKVFSSLRSEIAQVRSKSLWGLGSYIHVKAATHFLLFLFVLLALKSIGPVHLS